MKFIRSRFLTACVASIVTAFVVGGVASAMGQSPIDGNRVIHACYNRQNGNVRLAVNGACQTKGEKTPITWNAQGRPGPPGTPGTIPIFAVLNPNLDTNGSDGKPGSPIPIVSESHLVSAVYGLPANSDGTTSFATLTFDHDLTGCAITISGMGGGIAVDASQGATVTEEVGNRAGTSVTTVVTCP